MIHVSMSQENDIEGRQLTRPESRGDIPLGSERQRSDSDADASAQRWIREDPDTKEINQHRRVPEPRERELIISPVPWVGFVERSRDGSEISLADTPQMLETAERQLHLDVAE